MGNEVDPKHRPSSTISEDEIDRAQSPSPQQVENLKFQKGHSLRRVAADSVIFYLAL